MIACKFDQFVNMSFLSLEAPLMRIKPSIVLLPALLVLGFFLPPAPASAAVDTLVASNSVWKYFDLGTDQGTNWITPSFDDSSWLSGPGQLGYGDGDEATLLSNGTNGNVHVTAYFRQAFDVPNPGQYAVLSMRVQRDDGVIVYLNGLEVFRDNLPATGVTYATFTGSSVADDGRGWLPGIINVPLNYMIPGQNVLAAEIHQQGPGSSDITFALELVGNTQNNTPTVAIVSPTQNAFYTEPATIAISASASDSDGNVVLVEFFQGVTKLGEDNAAPFAFAWSGVAQGAYALSAVATDNLGAKATSAVVNVTVGIAIPPTVFSKSPAPGSVSALTAINVSFTDPVFGVSASDLLINGLAATSVSGSGSNYTFTFTQPAEGVVYVGWSGAHGIADFESPPKAFDPFSAGGTWQYTLTDTTAPTLTTLSPAAGATVRELHEMLLRGSKLVKTYLTQWLSLQWQFAEVSVQSYYTRILLSRSSAH